MNIIQAIRDPLLFRPYLADADDSLVSWQNWLTCLRVVYGLPLKTRRQRDIVQTCTARDPDRLPKNGFNKVLLLGGRRSGKSKVAGLIAAYEASLSGREKVLSAGEIGMVSIVSPSREQSQIIKSYCRAALGTPLLDNEVVGSTREGFPLANGVMVRILTGDFRAVRGYSQIAVVIDEICFFGYTEESKVKSDTELVRSVKPALLTTGGKLIAVSTKYAMRGWAYSTWKRHFGNDASRILVWDAASRTMNPTLSEEDIEAEIQEDPAAARAEFLNEWREDVQDYLPRSVVEACVIQNRTELLPRHNIQYRAFADVSGGRHDALALCIGHKEDRLVVIDFLKQWAAPCNPVQVVAEMATELKRYHLTRITGDQYAAQFTVQAFTTHGIRYMPSDKNKSQLYLELIGPVVAREIQLPDREDLINQIASLERRTRAGGRDIIDHPGGMHDDLANVIAGCCVGTSKGVFLPGIIGRRKHGRSRIIDLSGTYDTRPTLFQALLRLG